MPPARAGFPRIGFGYDSHRFDPADIGAHFPDTDPKWRGTIKGKTSEGLGFPGRGEGAVAFAVALVAPLS